MSDTDAFTSDDAAPAAAPPDRLVAGRYRLSSRRGSGIDIAIFEAVDLETDRVVAVKIIHPDLCAAEGFADRFTAVMERVAAIGHPNLAEVLDVGEATWSGRPVRYVVSENLTGGSLRDLRDRGRRLSPSQVVMVGLDVCRGLDAAHRAGFVHGDIRPANLVYGSDGRLRIAELGLADLVSSQHWADRASVSIDRAGYASPEQAKDEPLGPRSDVYSLSLCLLEAVTGQLPFIGESTVATLANRVDKLLPVSADLGPLAAVLERAGRPDPGDRYTAAELGAALRQAAEKLPRPAPIELVGSGLFAEAPGDPTSPTGVLRRPAVLPPPPPGAAPTPVAAVDEVVEPVAAPPTATVDPVPEPGAGAPDEAPSDAAAAPVAPTGAPTGADVASTEVVAAVPPPPPRDDAPPLLREPRSRRRLLVVTAIVIVAAALGGALFWVLGRDTSNAVPDLVGLEQGEALNMVSEFGWEVVTVTEASDEVQADFVVRTEPVAGERLDEGDPFTIVVSTGPAPRALPELTGLTVDAATAALAELDLLLEIGDQPNSEDLPVGVIISWKVPDQPALVAGDTVVPQTAVVVTVSAGPSPRLVPDLTGLGIVDATSSLQLNTLVLAQGPDEFSDTIPAGGVMRQDPAPGTPVERGSTVTVVLSKGQDLVAIPPLAGLTVAQATEALNAAGLVLGAVKGDPAGVNVLAEVGGTSIGANATFPRGTAIDLTFAVPAPADTVVA